MSAGCRWMRSNNRTWKQIVNVIPETTGQGQQWEDECEGNGVEPSVKKVSSISRCSLRDVLDPWGLSLNRTHLCRSLQPHYDSIASSQGSVGASTHGVSSTPLLFVGALCEVLECHKVDEQLSRAHKENNGYPPKCYRPSFLSSSHLNGG